MPPPRNPKEVKEFLGFAGYYHKFIPRFADTVTPMTSLTKKDVEFKCITTEPIPKYSDPKRPYILFTYASK